jgi:hypothetical protein
MAIYSQATDLATKQTIWVSRNVVKNKPQLNSHREDALGKSLQRAGVDGFSAVEISNLYASYHRNQN